MGDEFKEAESTFYCHGNRSSFTFLQYNNWKCNLDSDHYPSKVFYFFSSFINTSWFFFNSSTVSVFANCPISDKLLCLRKKKKSKRIVAIQWIRWVKVSLTGLNSPKWSSTLQVNYQFALKEKINVKYSVPHYQNLVHPKLNSKQTYFDIGKMI